LARAPFATLVFPCVDVGWTAVLACQTKLPLWIFTSRTARSRTLPLHSLFTVFALSCRSLLCYFILSFTYRLSRGQLPPPGVLALLCPIRRRVSNYTLPRVVHILLSSQHAVFHPHPPGACRSTGSGIGRWIYGIRVGNEESGRKLQGTI
jgi:hypothetical protein